MSNDRYTGNDDIYMYREKKGGLGCRLQLRGSDGRWHFGLIKGSASERDFCGNKYIGDF